MRRLCRTLASPAALLRNEAVQPERVHLGSSSTLIFLVARKSLTRSSGAARFWFQTCTRSCPGSAVMGSALQHNGGGWARHRFTLEADQTPGLPGVHMLQARRLTTSGAPGWH